MPEPLRVAFLGCGFITRVHSGHLRALGGDVVASYASRDRTRRPSIAGVTGAPPATATTSRRSPTRVEPVVIAVPPRFHFDLALRACAPASTSSSRSPRSCAWQTTAPCARRGSGRTHRARRRERSLQAAGVRLRRLLAERAIGELVFAHFVTIARRLKSEDDWRNDEAMAGGDAFFEEGIHWLHIAGSLGPKIVEVRGYRPSVSRDGPDRRVKSMMVAFRYDNDAVGALFYSREIPSLFRGLRWSKLFGRRGVIVRIERPVRVRAR